MTEELEYKVGGMNINPDKLVLWGPFARHKFIVEALDNVVSIYISQEIKHKDVVEKFNVKDQNVVGGGNCYTNEEKKFILDDYSGDYGAIPEKAAQRFAELMLPELEKMGIEVSGIVAQPMEFKLNSYWKE